MNAVFAKPRIVVITDAPETRELFLKTRTAHSVSIVGTTDQDQGAALIAGASLIVLDQAAVVKTDARWFRANHSRNPNVPVLVIGVAADVPPPQFTGIVVRFVERLPERSQLWRAIEDALEANSSTGQARAGELCSPAYLSTGKCAQQIEPLVAAMAQVDVPVLIQGETGVGKEVLARHIHALSARASGPFLKVNCAALPSELIESELFGYERGAFTGAFRSTPGKFELAEGGVLLLDEIGDMDVRVQSKLLQVLQDHEFHRLGATRSSRVDVRVIAATHCDLEVLMVEKRFREDLYYRLNVANIVLPPLRERLDEIIPLAEYFLRKHARVAHVAVPEITDASREALLSYDWPGNVRELENLMRKHLAMPYPELLLEDLQRRSARRLKAISASAGFSGMSSGSVNLPVTDVTREDHPRANGTGASTMAQVEAYQREAEAEAICKALENTHWHRKRAAALLQVDYKVFLYRMKRLGIGLKHKTESSAAPASALDSGGNNSVEAPL